MRTSPSCNCCAAAPCEIIYEESFEDSSDETFTPPGISRSRGYQVRVELKEVINGSDVETAEQITIKIDGGKHYAVFNREFYNTVDSTGMQHFRIKQYRDANLLEEQLWAVPSVPLRAGPSKNWFNYTPFASIIGNTFCAGLGRGTGLAGAVSQQVDTTSDTDGYECQVTIDVTHRQGSPRKEARIDEIIAWNCHLCPGCNRCSETDNDDNPVLQHGFQVSLETFAQPFPLNYIIDTTMVFRVASNADPTIEIEETRDDVRCKWLFVSTTDWGYILLLTDGTGQCRLAWRAEYINSTDVFGIGDFVSEWFDQPTTCDDFSAVPLYDSTDVGGTIIAEVTAI